MSSLAATAFLGGPAANPFFKKVIDSQKAYAALVVFQKSGSCKCSDRARSCNPLYPSLCPRSFTFHHRYRYSPFSAAVSDCLLDVVHIPFGSSFLETML
jgi:hypothetical protein